MELLSLAFGIRARGSADYPDEIEKQNKFHGADADCTEMKDERTYPHPRGIVPTSRKFHRAGITPVGFSEPTPEE